MSDENQHTDSDRNILISTLQHALPRWKGRQLAKTLLAAYPPGDRILAPLAAAIDKCQVVKRVDGWLLFSGHSAGHVSLNGPTLAEPLLYRANRADVDDEARAISDAADWLIRTLETRQATGLFIHAIWGLSIDREVEIANGITLLPFEGLRNSSMKRWIVQRASKEHAVWEAQHRYGLPGAAMVQKIVKFPFIDYYSGLEAIDLLIEIESKSREPLIFLQVAAQPLVAGRWFEYEDEDLDFVRDEHYVGWILPEILPRVQSHVNVDSATIERDAAALWKLPTDWRNKLLRSMERFVLSQCRHQIGDRAIDLATAFEIAVSDKGIGENAPVSWKVAVRSTQAIGGRISQRQKHRQELADLYKLRSARIHGGSQKASEKLKDEAILAKGKSIYQALLLTFLSQGEVPDWQSLELESRTRE